MFCGIPALSPTIIRQFRIVIISLPIILIIIFIVHLKIIHLIIDNLHFVICTL